ncbi:PH domain-containing protein [Streptomyces chromofuscus]|uniref:PH domain-containing protein n=1 Tax=Streptomyces chromofuscus TaxID=42881 RepID=A0A7M2T3Z2_STRCW|nr:PH domain-containing protein [Streptomyces chromofuscus]QOV42603.1 PH domain-containing protein [Streptomyces chromofuscus]GGT43648.1 membrane protein [Streptomyces chromofuscus]
MTTPDQPSPAPQPPRPTTRDRVYRSPMGLVGGVLMLGLAAWLGVDAIIRGEGRTPWLALATLLLVVPLVVAFTLRPAVYAGEDRLRVRNPFRSIVLPWGEVASLRSGYTNEVVSKAGTKFQLWAVPVSLRGRGRAARKEARRASQAAGDGRTRARGIDGLADVELHDGPFRAESDQIMHDLRLTLEAREKARTAQGEVTVRWAYEIAGPAVAGAVLLVILLVAG